MFWTESARADLLFDPQTAGTAGRCACLASHARDIVARLRDAERARRSSARSDGKPFLTVDN
ncbi:MAG: hypothetical protein R3D61_11005 [Defluviimonas denitrificans]